MINPCYKQIRNSLFSVTADMYTDKSQKYFVKNVNGKKYATYIPLEEHYSSYFSIAWLKNM